MDAAIAATDIDSGLDEVTWSVETPSTTVTATTSAYGANATKNAKITDYTFHQIITGGASNNYTPGEYYISAVVKDNAGNTVDVEKQGPFLFDGIKPAVTLSDDGESQTQFQSDVTITMEATEGELESGIDSIALYKDSTGSEPIQTWSAAGAKSWTESYDVTESGTYILVVTDIAGTTRDILEETIVLHGISLRMIDTAGIRDTEDKVEQIGVGRAKEYAKDADLILYVVDSSRPLDENDEEIMEILEDKKAIVLLNKTDLEQKVTEEMLKEKLSHPVVSISAKEEQGIDVLEQEIKNMFFEGELSFNDEVYITNMRHKTALEEALDSLKMVENSIEMQMPEDFFSIDLMNAYESLGSIIGEAVGEDLVNEIFSKFCTGK